MTTMALMISAVLSLLGIWYLLLPLAQTEAPHSNSTSDTDTDRENRCMQVLRDLELDYRTGKISLHDYTETKSRLEFELVSLLKKSTASDE